MKAGPMSDVFSNIIDQTMLMVVGDLLKNISNALGLDVIISLVQTNEGIKAVEVEELFDFLV